MARIIEHARLWTGLMVAALPQIPPVTVLLIIAMILAYFDCTSFHQLPAPEVTSLAWRALLSVFYHKRELHLFLDLTWTLITGTRLEKLLGSWSFLHTTALMIFLTQASTLLINLPYAYLTNHPQSSITHALQSSHYNLGFSGVLFALYFLLITTSNHDHQLATTTRQYNHNGLLVEGLLLIAAFQALILPDSHFFNNLSGIVAGFVYVNTPPMLGGLVVCGMAIYNETLRFMSSTDWEDLYKSDRNANYYSDGDDDDDDDDHLSQEGAFTIHYDNNHHEVEQDEEDQLDIHLEWECRACFSKNGVFFSFCETCTQPRPP